MSDNIVIMNHPLIKHKISMIRNKETGTSEFRKLIEEIAMLMGYEALSDLPAQDDAIDAFLQKRFHGKKPDRGECKRAADARLRRGHSWNDIRRALERYAPEEDFCGDAY